MWISADSVVRAFRISPWLASCGDASNRGSSSAQQIDDQNRQGYHQQEMDEAAGHVKAESEQPQNEKHNENRPKHSGLLVAHCDSAWSAFAILSSIAQFRK